MSIKLYARVIAEALTILSVGIFQLSERTVGWERLMRDIEHAAWSSMARHHSEAMIALIVLCRDMVHTVRDWHEIVKIAAHTGQLLWDLLRSARK